MTELEKLERLEAEFPLRYQADILSFIYSHDYIDLSVTHSHAV